MSSRSARVRGFGLSLNGCTATILDVGIARLARRGKTEYSTRAVAGAYRASAVRFSVAAKRPRPDELGSVPIAATTRLLIQATQEGLDHGGIVLAERGAMGGD
jgi:hypothetical protein